MLNVPAFLPVHCRTARALLDLTQAELGERASVSRMTVKAFESGHAVRPVVANALQDALAAEGVLFLGGASICDGHNVDYGVALIRTPDP